MTSSCLASHDCVAVQRFASSPEALASAGKWQAEGGLGLFCPTVACAFVRRSVEAASRSPQRLGRPFVAIDVEYATFKVDDQQQSFPAEVCIVAINEDVLLHKYCRPGVNCHLLRSAASLDETLDVVEAVIAGCTLVGHGLKNDLAALRLDHPAHLVRDTATYPKFQRRDGSAFTLKRLVKMWLGKDIQPASVPHSAREDAAAVMELYKRVILTDVTQLKSEAEIVDAYLTGAL